MKILAVPYDIPHLGQSSGKHKLLFGALSVNGTTEPHNNADARLACHGYLTLFYDHPDARISRATHMLQFKQRWDVASPENLSVVISASNQAVAPFLLLLRDGVELDTASVDAMIKVSEQLEGPSVVAAHVVSKAEPWKVLNGGYYRSPITLLWQGVRLSLSEQFDSADSIGNLNQLSLGAALMKFEVAEKIGGLEGRFGTHLGDVDWCMRARKAGISLVLISGIRAYATPVTYKDGLDNLYLVTRDTLLLSRKHNLFWPLSVLRIVLRLVLGRWIVDSPFILSASVHVPLPKRILWSGVDYLRAVRKQMISQESQSTLAAVKDFLLKRYSQPPK